MTPRQFQQHLFIEPPAVSPGGVMRCVPVIDESLRRLCTRRYPGHPHGCPNHGKRAACPPRAPLLYETLDVTETIFCAWNVFPFGEHVERMREKQPAWSERQLACCLYWQGRARKELRLRVEAWLAEHPGIHWRVLYCPEACGVNVSETMRCLGHKLEWPPHTVAHQVALIGHRTPGTEAEA